MRPVATVTPLERQRFLCFTYALLFSPPSVSSLPEKRREQAADHAAEAQAVQEPDHPGL